jgi:hypothetical protein
MRTSSSSSTIRLLERLVDATTSLDREVPPVDKASHLVLALSRPFETLDWTIMAGTKTQITENDYVELMRPSGKWPAKLVEVSDDQGVMLDLVEVDELDLKLIAPYPSVPSPSLALSHRP